MEKRTLEMTSLQWAMFLSHNAEELIILPNQKDALTESNFTNSTIILKVPIVVFSKEINKMKRNGFDYCISEVILVSTWIDPLTYVTLSILAHVLSLRVTYQKYIQQREQL